MAHTSTKTKALIATAGLIGLGVLTAGTASASTTPAPAPSTVVEAPTAVTPEVSGAEAPDATEVAGSETEGVGDGNDGGHEDANGVDVAGADDATEVAGSETEGVEDGNDGGHQDADGVDIQHEGGADEL